MIVYWVSRSIFHFVYFLVQGRLQKKPIKQFAYNPNNQFVSYTHFFTLFKILQENKNNVKWNFLIPVKLEKLHKGNKNCALSLNSNLFKKNAGFQFLEYQNISFIKKIYNFTQKMFFYATLSFFTTLKNQNYTYSNLFNFLISLKYFNNIMQHKIHWCLSLYH